MKNHTDLLNYLIQTFDLKSYLEIGVFARENNFNKINLPWRQTFCVDPDPKCKADFIGTSDEYFDEKYFEDLKTDKNNYWDLIFIDGLHHADQVRRDFENSLKCLSDNGFIVIHDTLPTDERYTHVPRDSKIWFGDVWKFAIILREYDNISFVTVDMDCGCTVVWKEYGTKGRKEKMSLTWDFYRSNKELKMRVVKPNEFKSFFHKKNIITT